MLIESVLVHAWKTHREVNVEFLTMELNGVRGHLQSPAGLVPWRFALVTI
jgi:hypothetical protein